MTRKLEMWSKLLLKVREVQVRRDRMTHWQRQQAKENAAYHLLLNKTVATLQFAKDTQEMGLQEAIQETDYAATEQAVTTG